MAETGAAGTGGSGGPSGHSMQTMPFAGETRTYALHVPAAYDGKRPVPLLLHFHGWRPPPLGVSDELKYVWGPTCESAPLIAAEGLPCPELDPQTPYGCFRESRDAPFVAALIQKLGQMYNLDPDRVFLSGHSGGAFFVEEHALRHSDTYVAAVAFAGGCIGSSDTYGNSCSVYKALSSAATRKIPFFVAHNAKDQVVPVTYSASLLKLLEEGGHPTKATSDYDGGSTGHSIDASIVPPIWTWLAGFTL